MDQESTEAAIRRSREAYARIKMGSQPPPKTPPLNPMPHQAAVERITDVINALKIIEHTHALLHPSVSKMGRRSAFAALKQAHSQLKKYRSVKLVARQIEKLERKMHVFEESMDLATVKRLKKAVANSDASSNWSKYLVNREKKKTLFIATIQSHIEKEAVPAIFAEQVSSRPVPLVDTVAYLASEVYTQEEVKEIGEVVKEVLDKNLKHTVADTCYARLKSMSSPKSRIVSVIRSHEAYRHGQQQLTGRPEPDKDVLDIYSGTCKSLFLEVESGFAKDRIDERRMYDTALADVLEVVSELDRHPKIFERWGNKRQPMLRALAIVSQERSSRAKSKLGSFVFLYNSANMLKKTGAKDLPLPDDLIVQIKKELKHSMLRHLEKETKDRKKSPLASLLRYLEALANRTQGYYIPDTKKQEILSQFKQDIRKAAEEAGGLSEVSDKHLSSCIHRMFGGVIGPPADSRKQIKSESPNHK